MATEMTERYSTKTIKSIFSNRMDSLANYCSIHPETHKGQNFKEQENLATDVAFLIPEGSQSLTVEYTPVLESVRNFAGEWRIHRFEKYPWSDQEHAFVKFKKTKRVDHDKKVSEENEEDEDEQDIASEILTDEMIKNSLTYLDRSPIYLKFVLCKCILSNMDLTDISAIKYYHYIQYLDISKNDLTTLSPLSQLPFLQYLNASSNYLKTVLDFRPPFFLSYVDLSYNSITYIPDLTEFWSITDLNLSHNDIDKISGLENLRFLNFLDLSFNKILALDNLNNLRIQFLNLNNNVIDSSAVEEDPLEFRTLDFIRHVNLSNNQITSLKMIQGALNIEAVDLSNNNISSLLELYYLNHLKYLARVNLKNNPVAELSNYFKVCLYNIPNLIILDGKEVSADSRINVRTDISPLQPGKINHADLILLQQINNPDLGSFMLPINHPPPVIVFFVGPPGSRKKSLARKLCKLCKRIVPGVIHTTRPRIEHEIPGEDYYFVTKEEFKDLIRHGKFVAVSEFYGNSYGITEEEIYRDVNKVLVFCTDFKTAISVQLRGVITKLVLALPRSEATHLKWLKEKYFINEMNENVICINNIATYRSSQLHLHTRKVLYTEQKSVVDALLSETLRSISSQDTNLSMNPLSFETTDFSIDESADQGSVSSLDTKHEEKIETAPSNIQNEEEILGRESKRVSFSKDLVDPVPDKADKERKDSSSNTEKLESFFKRIIKSRQELLEIHWSNLGLFNIIVFTDEFRSSLRKLKVMLKNLAENMKSVHSPLIYFKNDETYERMINIRLALLDLEGFTHFKKYEVFPHCECNPDFWKC